MGNYEQDVNGVPHSSLNVVREGGKCMSDLETGLSAYINPKYIKYF
jgi:hypothetical protein